MNSLSKIAGLTSTLLLNACSHDSSVKIEDLHGLDEKIVSINGDYKELFRQTCDESNHPGLLVARKTMEEFRKYVDEKNTFENREALIVIGHIDRREMDRRLKQAEEDKELEKYNTVNPFLQYRNIADRVDMEVWGEGELGNQYDDVWERFDIAIKGRDANLAEAGLAINPAGNSGWNCNGKWGPVNQEYIRGDEYDGFFNNVPSFETYVVPSTHDAQVKYFESR